MSSWWSNDRISATVTEEYISTRLGPKKQRILQSPLAFGAGLTDDTYLDWILSRSPRLFLILDDIGCVEHIFTAVDRSFDDDDLALNEQAIVELGLSNVNGKKFAKRQYAFLVQDLCEGAHVDYGDDHVIPIKSIAKKQGIQLSANLERVQVGDKQFLRRRISLDEESGIEKIHFILHFKSLQRLRHPHLTSVWATYSFRDNGYLLLQPSTEMTLKAFFEDPPKHFRNLSKTEQRDIIIRWIQCLVNALAYLHENGYAHQAIRPSNILLDSHYNIFLGDYGALGALEDKEPHYAKDAYNHGAPEQWQRKATLAETNPLRSTLQSGGRTGRRIRPASSSAGTTIQLPSPTETPRASSRASNNQDFGTMSNAAGTRTSTASSSSTAPTNYTSSTSSSGGRRPNRTKAVVTTLTYSQPNPSKTLFDASPFYPSDVFALCTVITSLLSLLASLTSSGSKLSPSHIPTHLGKRNRNAGRGGKGGAPADVSWHSNLGQVSTWLDALDASASEKPTKKLSLGRKSSSDKDGDSESWRWKGFLRFMTDMMRYGFQKDVSVRWTAPAGVAQISAALKKWRIEPAHCCEGIKSQPPSNKSVKSTVESVKSVDKKSNRSAKSAKSTKSRTPTTPSIPEEDYPIRSPTLTSPTLAELPGEDLYSPHNPAYFSPTSTKKDYSFPSPRSYAHRFPVEKEGIYSPVSPITPFPLNTNSYIKYDGPSISELPARESDICSPQRERFILPHHGIPRQTSDFDFQFTDRNNEQVSDEDEEEEDDDDEDEDEDDEEEEEDDYDIDEYARDYRHHFPIQRTYSETSTSTSDRDLNRTHYQVPSHPQQIPHRNKYPISTHDSNPPMSHESSREYHRYQNQFLDDDEESVLGLDNWPSPMAHQKQRESERQRQRMSESEREHALRQPPSREPPRRELPKVPHVVDNAIDRVMDRPRPPTSGLVPHPLRGTHRTGAAM